MSAEAVSRNARCPCGSGHRYKDCCGSLSARVSGQTLSLAPFLPTGLPEPRLADGNWQLCTDSQFDDPAYAGWCGVLKEAPLRHRKQWEFVYILASLHGAGLLREGTRCLGFGCGKEPLAAVFASYGCEVVATDLDASAAAGRGWIETEQHASQLEDLNERGICPPREFAERVRFIAQDMNAISPDLRDFDFVWSSCAFEHLGSLRKGCDFVLNAMQCLKPGGLAIHTTEFNLSSNVNTVESTDLSVYRKRDMDELRERLVAASHELPPMNLNPGATALDRHVDLPPYRREPHLRLLLGNFVLTSIGLIARRGGAG